MPRAERRTGRGAAVSGASLQSCTSTAGQVGAAVTLAGLSAPAAASAAVPPRAAAASERGPPLPTATEHKGQCDDTTTKLIDMIITLRDRALQSILTLTLP